MPEINYKELKKHLSGLVKNKLCPVWLIHGDDFLCKNAFEEVLNIIVPAEKQSLNYEPVDNDNVYDAIEKVNTFSMLSDIKAVSLIDSKIFYSKQDDNTLFQKIRDAFNSKDIKKAAKFLTAFLGIKKLSFEDIEKTGLQKNITIDSEIIGNGKWLDEIIDYCKDKNLLPTSIQDNAGYLQKAIEKGFPVTNYLIITTDMVDKRKGLFKSIKKNGIIVDCTVPKGSTRADKTVQDAVLREQMIAILSKSRKNIDGPAYKTLCDMTGFNLRTFTNNLEKLVSYVGDNPNITVDDVKSVLKRTRKDPIYELTSALAERNFENSLFFLHSLLSEGLFSLQILSAMTNQIRKLLVVKGFTQTKEGKIWKKQMSYNQFQKSVIPAIVKHDQLIINELEKWQNIISQNINQDKEKKNKAAAKPTTDTIIAKNPKSPYPIYLTFKNADKFTKQKLINIIENLNKADLQLKTTARDPKMILEQAVVNICHK